MQKNAYPMNGAVLHESDVPGYPVSYRFHLVDPVRFSKSIRVTLEHGHGNHLSDDWSSTAYWYQTLPSPILTVPGVEERLPLRPMDRIIEVPLPELTPEQQAARDKAAERMQRFVAARDAMRAERRAE